LLAENNMGWAKVDVVLTTGGASRMPMVRRMLKQIGGYKTLNTSLSPDQSIAHGATYYAGMLLANNAFEKKDADNTIKWATATVELLKTKPAPQGVGPEDWEKKKNTISGIALWMTGMTYASKSNHPQTDAVLRQAVPLIQGNDTLTSHALFQLGLANHRMGESKKNVQLIQEAYNFFRQCGAVKGPNQGAAAKNAAVLRTQYRGLK